MPNGYAGKLLFVDLSTGDIQSETPDESLYRDFIGCYGVGARILYSRMRAGVDPLGPKNMLGLLNGVLTGTTAVMGSRFQVVGKSPLTGGWGDANAGGHFGPRLKFAGYDGVFFTGIASSPVYLYIENGKAELREADDLWGKDIYETEDTLKSRHGGETRVACIGQAAEKLSLISCIVNEKGAAAGRSGLGAVMGSKKLKAVVVKGNMRFPIADQQRLLQVRNDHLNTLRAATADGESWWDGMNKYGTARTTAVIALNGDTPIMNFGGVGVVDYPDPGTVSGDGSIHNKVEDETCWGCAVACEAILGPSTGPYPYDAGNRRAEYETLAAYGGYLLNNDIEVVNKANDICNRAGLDTISAGTAVAFAIECYQNGLLNLEDTDGIDLRWGDGPGVIALTEKMARREGLGDVLADGGDLFGGSIIVEVGPAIGEVAVEGVDQDFVAALQSVPVGTVGVCFGVLKLTFGFEAAKGEVLQHGQEPIFGVGGRTNVVREHDGWVEAFHIGFDHAIEDTRSEDFGIAASKRFGGSGPGNGQASAHIKAHHQGVDFFARPGKGSILKIVGQDLGLVKFGGHHKLA